MSVKIVQRFLTRKNADEYKKVFKLCFPNVGWRVSVPFPKDPVYAAINPAGAVIGFCMVHEKPPEKMKYGPGAYMYNLCVVPTERRKGVAQMLLDSISQKYSLCYSHMDKADYAKLDTLMSRSGWTCIGTVRNYYEYAKISGVEKFVDGMASTRYYDAVNNVIYLD